MENQLVHILSKKEVEKMLSNMINCFTIVSVYALPILL